jgi:coproporphyrinogen III oxidase-like Fe-S oxidoreductase
MTKVTYKMPTEDDSAVVTMGGVRFFDGQSVEVDEEEHEHLLSKLRTNQHFEVADSKPKAPKADSKPKAPAEGLRAVHIAGGRFKIVDGDRLIKEGLNKAEADSFNALSDEDKAALVD